jgi:hypothetical protein
MKTFLFLLISSSCAASAMARVSYEPSIALGGGYYDLSADSPGSALKLNGRLAPEFRPGLTLILNDEFDQVDFHLSGRQFDFEFPQGTVSMIHNSQYFWGGGFGFSRYLFAGRLSLGLEFSQYPVASARDPGVVLLKKASLFSLPIEYSTKLITTDAYCLKVGSNGALSTAWFKNAAAGHRVAAFVETEIRGRTNLNFRGYYGIRSLTLASTSQSGVEIGLLVRYGISEARDAAPPDERETTGHSEPESEFGP